MKKLNRNGEKHKQQNNGIIEIIKYFNTNNITIKFEDNTILNNISFGQIKDGLVKNPNKPSLNNIGYIGIGKYSTKNIKIYSVWTAIFSRCYSEKQQELQPSYVGCTVDERWHSFQVFAQWFEQNYIDGFQLDKDILIKGNKIYGPDTCCFVPYEINKSFTKSNSIRGLYPIGVDFRKDKNKFRAKISKFGKIITLGCTFKTIEEAFNVYKINKEFYCKQLAEKYKNLISDKVYQALLNYQVEITD